MDTKKLKQVYELGVACIDKHTMNTPFLLKKKVTAETYDEARSLFLADPTVAKLKVNDIVMVHMTPDGYIPLVGNTRR